MKQISLNHQSANELNKSSNCCWHDVRAASLSFISYFFLSFSSLIPNLDDVVLGKLVSSYVGQWNVPLKQGSDPWFLISVARRCKDAQSPWASLLCTRAPPCLPHCLNAAAKCLVLSMDRQEEQDQLPICLGLEFYSISYHALALYAEAWHSILHLTSQGHEP